MRQDMIGVAAGDIIDVLTFDLDTPRKAEIIRQRLAMIAGLLPSDIIDVRPSAVVIHEAKP